MADVKITLKPNGPALVEGKIEIINSSGDVVPVDPNKPAIALCRCGHSANKPFCDGSHKAKSWQE